MSNTEDRKFVTRLIVTVLISILLFASGLSATGCVDAGNRGVLVTAGRVEETVLGEGFYFKKPFIQSVVEMNVQTSKVEAKAEASSKDLQLVGTTVVLNSHLDPAMAAKVYASIGVEYQDRVVVPAISESLKQSTAHFTAEELITKRAEAKKATLDLLKERLTPIGVIVEDISITDFQFSKAFNHAIEEKVTAEQLKLKADRDLERIRTEAEQVKAKAVGDREAAIAKAQGEAEAVKIVSEQLKASPQYIEWMQVSRWDGRLPQVTSGAIPMIQVK